MIRIITLFIITLLSKAVLSQTPVVEEISQLIMADEFEKAESRVAYYLKKNPKDVDALMMKGNIIVNKNCCDRLVIMEANTEESIYEESIGFLHDGGPVVVSKHVASEVAGIWKKAVSYDLSRSDIHFGICHIYSMALMTDELIDYLPIIKKYVTNNEKLHYTLCEYARNIKERGDFESAIRIYQFIAGMYPEHPGLLSDIAAEYFTQGDIYTAMKYMEKAIQGDNIDEMTWGNAFFFNSVMGNYDKALMCLKKQSELIPNHEYLFYQGLLAFSRRQDWETTLQQYQEAGSNETKLEICKYMLSDEFVENLENYLHLNELNLNDAYKILLHESFQKMTPEHLKPFFSYAELLTYNQVFTEAIKTFEYIENSNLIKEQAEKELVNYYFGWALWKSGNRLLSLNKWEALLQSDQFVYKSAAAYFIGKYYYDQQEMKKAKEYFELVQDKADRSKYATMAWNYYRNIE